MGAREIGGGPLGVAGEITERTSPPSAADTASEENFLWATRWRCDAHAGNRTTGA